MAQKIIIYTDGSALGNPGPGGYGVVLKYGKHRKEISKGFRKTTNNRMELLAVIEALTAIKNSQPEIEIYSDSEYVINAINKGWVFSWAAKGFKKKKNPDLWSRFLKLQGRFNVSYKWIKAHAGIPDNERCDQLAKQAAEKPTETDHYFEEAERNNDQLL